MRRFFIEPSKAADSTVSIIGSDANHIKNVLRLKIGDVIVLFDGTGNEYEAEITALFSDCISVSIHDRFFAKTESPVQIIIAQALLKDKKMDGIIRQLTELGISQWIPFVAVRSVSRPDKNRLAVRTEKWKKIARESLKQCRRGKIPEISDTVSFEDALKYGEKCDLKIIFWENETKSVKSVYSSEQSSCFPAEQGNEKTRSQAGVWERVKKIFAMLGPEGGFTTQEIELARNYGCVTVSLGPRILRAETAVIAASALLQHIFGDM